jgi:hypothetical protein
MKNFGESNHLAFVKDNLVVIVCSISVLIHILLSTISPEKVYIARTGEEYLSPSRTDFCLLFGEQLIKKKVHPLMIDEGMHKQLSKNNYEIMEFSGNERIFSISEKKDGCSLVLKDDIGLRIFELSLKAEKSNQLHYFITGFSEKLNAAEGV